MGCSAVIVEEESDSGSSADSTSPVLLLQSKVLRAEVYERQGGSIFFRFIFGK